MTGMEMSQLLPECENPESAEEVTDHAGNEILPTATEQSGIQEPAEKDGSAPASKCRISGRQRRLSLEEYRSTFLQVPRIEDRKPVFVSCEVRDRLDEYVRKLGSRRMSVSGLLENIARQHLEIYSEDFEQWRKPSASWNDSIPAFRTRQRRSTDGTSVSGVSEVIFRASRKPRSTPGVAEAIRSQRSQIAGRIITVK